ncbi:hypothetical protein ADL19_17865 [Streptomyces purpurogeneiscleroticus]|nr:hypothetical protein ADL19_17865 [Streptomyces purpurogeneiscleroticus]
MPICADALRSQGPQPRGRPCPAGQRRPAALAAAHRTHEAAAPDPGGFTRPAFLRPPPDRRR